MHKAAPNQSDQKVIKQRALAGDSPEEIARALMMNVGPVESWCKHFIEEDKKQKDANAAAQAEAAKRAEEAAKAQREALKAEIRAELEAEAKAEAEAAKAKTTAAPKVNK